MTTKAPHRNLCLSSRIITFPVHLTGALLHFITSPLGIEEGASMLFSGGFFSFLLIPLTFYGLTLHIISSTFNHLYNMNINLVTQFGLPMFHLYLIQVILLDKSHLQPKHAAPIPPQNWMEQNAHKFYNASMNYFPITIQSWKQNATLSPNSQYIFAVHPHAIHCLPLGLFTTYESDFDIQFPQLVGFKITALAATVIFKIPVVREMFLQMGYCDASRPIASQILECGRSIAVCTGGEEESMYTTKGNDIVVLQKRKGFIRLALSYGVDIVPVFGVGNSDTYQTYAFMAKQRKWLQKKAGIALPIFHGRFFTPLPYKVPIKTLIGEPISTPIPKVKGEKPSDELVNQYHAMYIEALKKLYKEHVCDRVLEIK